MFARPNPRGKRSTASPAAGPVSLIQTAQSLPLRLKLTAGDRRRQQPQYRAGRIVLQKKKTG